MSNVIKSFLVGVGYDYDKKGEQSINSGINSIKSTVLQLGAVVAGGFGLRELTTNFADAKDSIGKFGEVFGVVPADITAFGQALAHEGGSLESFMSQLQSLEKLRVGVLAGDAGFLGELGKFGIDGNVIIDAKNATEAYKALADEFANASKQQRIGAAGVLGFDDASIRLLSGGSSELQRVVDEEKAVRNTTDEMTRISKDFNDATQRFGDFMGGFADQISTTILPGMIKTTESINGFFAENKSTIDNAIKLTPFLLKKGAGDLLNMITPSDAGEFRKDPATYLNEPPRLIDKMRLGTQPMDIEAAFNSEVYPSNLAAYTDGLISSNTQPLTSPNTTTSQTTIVEANLMLDGRIIDQKILNVISGEAQTAIDDINSSVKN